MTTHDTSAGLRRRALLDRIPGLREAKVRLRRKGLEAMFHGLARAGALHPRARPARHGVERKCDIPYRDTGLEAHRLDVWRPVGAGSNGALRPVCLYIHGGGFTMLSKDTHWLMGLSFARRGYVVFNVNYRLTPQHPFPAGLEDVCAAWRWVLANAARFGGDPQRIVVAGESAGANLAAALTVATCYRRDEPFARETFDAGTAPLATLPFCGILQVSDPGRFKRRKAHVPTWLDDQVHVISARYLATAMPGTHDLADPLLVMEQGRAPDRSLPPFFLTVGTRDVLLDDTRRMARALEALGVPCEVRYYAGGIHAFHAFTWQARARTCWSDAFAFLGERVPIGPPTARATA